MTQNDLLTRMEKPGLVEFNLADFFSYGMDPKILDAHLLALRAQGHAISMDETFETGGRSLGLRVFHNRNCRACLNK